MSARRARLEQWLVAAALAAGAFSCAGACGQRSSEPPAADTTPGDVKPAENAEPAQPALCNGEACEPPKQCIRYSGIAGPSVPLFACGIPCSAEGTCPSGMSCQAIADGPRLCR